MLIALQFNSSQTNYGNLANKKNPEIPVLHQQIMLYKNTTPQRIWQDSAGAG